MAEFTIRNNSKINLLTQEELSTELDRVTVNLTQEAARGVTTDRFFSVATVAAGALSLPANDQQKIGPTLGFAWAVQRVTAAGLGTTDVLAVYRNSVSAFNLLGVVTASSSLHVGSKGIILRGGETLYLAGSSLSAIGDIAVNGEVIEVPELDLYKLL